MVVKKSKNLEGSVVIDGAKNAVLPLLASALLMDEGEVLTLTNVPKLSDVKMMVGVLSSLNMEVSYKPEEHWVKVIAHKPLGTEASYDYVSKMRASSIVLGPILTKELVAKIAMPGGCTIGSRPLDIHFKGLEQLGAKIEVKNGFINAKAPKGLKGTQVVLDFPSVGATENILMASVLAKGVTEIINVAREPEITDLILQLNDMGAKIKDDGAGTLVVEGVEHLHGTSHTVVQDRIEAGTFMVAVAVVGGNVLIKDCVVGHNVPLISKLSEMGVKFKEEDGGLRVISNGKLKNVNVKTQPYPGFPTDMQSQMTVAQLCAKGVGIMEETVFENRFMHLSELGRMGAKYTIKDDSAIIEGSVLSGAEVASTDLRASASLIIAGLVANGTTTVTNLVHLDRGYDNFEGKLRALGGNIERVKG